MSKYIKKVEDYYNDGKISLDELDKSRKIYKKLDEKEKEKLDSEPLPIDFKKIEYIKIVNVKKLKFSFYFSIINCYLILLASIILIFQENPQSFILSGGGFAILYFFHSTYKPLFKTKIKRQLNGFEKFCRWLILLNASLIALSFLLMIFFVFIEGFSIAAIFYGIYLLIFSFSLIYYTNNATKYLT